MRAAAADQPSRCPGQTQIRNHDGPRGPIDQEAEGKRERSKAHELQGTGNATGKLVEGELPDDAAERKALMDQAPPIGARSA